jgi:hypothetical protein
MITPKEIAPYMALTIGKALRGDYNRNVSKREIRGIEHLAAKSPYWATPENRVVFLKGL